ncbi:REP-associated tyrosine transposase [Pseudomonas sp. DC3000-4b1]|uniref:REP-associated tyrosine transposase n=1 Tax=unclassified Pseudomonas TaxID=196821 RepID=UPI003CF23925
MKRYRSSDLRKGRLSEAGHVYLITTATHERKPLFTCWKLGRLVCRELKGLHDAGQATSLAWVVMPDHLHWLFVLRHSHLARVIQRVKVRSALAINRALGRSGPVWQKGFHDHALRRSESLQATARYIIANPLRAGLVRRVGDYPLWDAIWLDPGDEASAWL